MDSSGAQATLASIGCNTTRVRFPVPGCIRCALLLGDFNARWDESAARLASGGAGPRRSPGGAAACHRIEPARSLPLMRRVLRTLHAVRCRLPCRLHCPASHPHYGSIGPRGGTGWLVAYHPPTLA